MIDTVETANEEIAYDETNQNYYYSGLSTYNTRATQYAHYGNLIRGSAITLNSTDNNTLLFRENDYAKGVFNISHTDRTDGIMPYGKIYFDVAMKVISRVNDYEAAFLNSNTISVDINSPYTKTVSAFDTNDFYMLPEGNQTFSFTPQYTSNYTITQTGDTSEVYVNGVQQTAQNGVFNVYMKKDTAYAIQFRNTSATSACYGTYKIEYASGSANISFALDYDDTYVLRYTPTTSGFYTLDAGENAVLTDVYTLNSSNGFTHTHSCNGKRVYEGYFTGGIDYYIQVKKTQNVTDDVTVGITPVTRSLVEGENPSVSLIGGDNYVYHKIVVPSNATTNQQYNFTFAGLTTSNLSYYLRTETGTGYNLSAVGVGYVYAQSLVAGKTYYLGIKCSIDVTVTPTYTIGEADHLWTIYKDGNTMPYLTTADDDVLLMRGHTYSFVLTVDEVTINPLTYTGSEEDNYDGNGTIEASSVIDMSVNTSIKGPNGMFELGIQFTVDPSEITVSVDYVNCVSVSFTAPTDILGYNYSVTGYDLNDTEFMFTGTCDTNGVDLLASLVSKNACYNVKFTVTSINVDDVDTTGNMSIATNGISKSISCGYTSSRTTIFKTTKYYITNALQLNNLRYYNSRSVYMSNDIELAASYPLWTPIPTYNATLHGNGHTIKGLNIVITNDGPDYYGLIGTTTQLQSTIIISGVNITTASGYNSTRTIYVGSFAGLSTGGLLQSVAYGNINVNTSHAVVGGLVGRMTDASVTICGFGNDDVRSTIKGQSDIGGVVGNAVNVQFSSAGINNTTIESTINDNSYSIGGIVAYAIECELTQCVVNNSIIRNVNTSTVSSSYTPKMGYLVGHMVDTDIDGTIDENSSYSTGRISNTVYCFNGDDNSYGLSQTTT